MTMSPRSPHLGRCTLFQRSLVSHAAPPNDARCHPIVVPRPVASNIRLTVLSSAHRPHNAEFGIQAFVSLFPETSEASPLFKAVSVICPRNHITSNTHETKHGYRPPPLVARMVKNLLHFSSPQQLCLKRALEESQQRPNISEDVQ